MNPLDPGTSRLLDTAPSGLSADARSLDSLKRQAARDPQAALKGAAQQFEALFLQMVLKSMRDAIPKSGLLDSDAQQTYTGMLDQQLSTSISKSGTGLANVIARQLGRHMMNGRAAPEAAATPATVTPAAASMHAPTSSLAAPTVSRAARAAIDRYTEIAKANPTTALRDAELARTNDAARAAYLNKTDAIAPAETTPQAAPAATASTEGTTIAPSLRYAQKTFVNRMWDHAVVAQQATGIPAKFVLGQAALESGWGTKEIRDANGLQTFNLFGIKAGNGWQGKTVDVTTTEYEGGVAKKVVQKFRAYNNYSEAFRDWAQLIGGNKRYAAVVESGHTSAAGFADGLARAGYATDPAYGAKLTRVIGTISSIGTTRSNAG